MHCKSATVTSGDLHDTGVFKYKTVFKTLQKFYAVDLITSHKCVDYGVTRFIHTVQFYTFNF
jgi:hypothetical protein